MYVYTAIIAGGFGLAEILAPVRVQSMLGMRVQDPIVFGLSASVFLGLGLVAILGVRAPLKYSPVLLVELVYKLIWLCGVVVPLALRGEFVSSSIVQVVIFGTFVVGDLIAIPFRYVFGRDIGAAAVEGD
jgi:formate/nitrite transporter FocA (FNT family)